ncbi:MAG: 4Fe-4S binding protein [Dehalococcoidales bacterium]
MGIKIDTTRCTGCGACTFVCPVGVLEIIDMKCMVKEGCISCGKCVTECDWQAITLEKEPKKK